MKLVIEQLRQLCSKKLLPITALNETMQKINVDLFKSSVQYDPTTPKRNIFYIDDKLALHTLGFKPNQFIPMQHYGHFNVFFVVLEGEIIEYVHIKPHLTTRHFIHSVGDGHYINEFIGYNQFYNKSNKDSSILQLFVI